MHRRCKNVVVSFRKKEVLPGFGGTGGHVHLFPWEQGNKGVKMRGTGEHRSKNEGNRGPMAILRNGEHRKSTFLFWGTGEQSDLFQGNKYICNFAGKA